MAGARARRVREEPANSPLLGRAQQAALPLEVSEAAVRSAKAVRGIAQAWISQWLPDVCGELRIGLPEVDDRRRGWRVPITLAARPAELVGELRVDFNGKVVRSTSPELTRIRVKRNGSAAPIVQPAERNATFRPAPVPNKVILGDAAHALEELPVDTAQLVITSPPYFNAKPESCEFIDYEEYLDFLRRVLVRVHRVLSEGRFCVINVSPVLIPRTSRGASSKRIPIPFDVHDIMDSVGFDFIDDIIWVKPEGAGWNLGRGRRFAADRQPLQYKPVTVTEYVLVYRKRTDKLIDWNIRSHYDQELVRQSKITGEYDVTNVWHIPPGHHPRHPAVFPDDLVRKLIRYYSFVDDLVLDPFAGSGTVGKVALTMKRRFLLIDNNPAYFRVIRREIEAARGSATVDWEVLDAETDALDER